MLVPVCHCFRQCQISLARQGIRSPWRGVYRPPSGYLISTIPAFSTPTPRPAHLWQAENEEALRSRDLARDMSPTVAKRLRQYQADFIERDATFNEMWTLYPKGVPTSTKVVFRGLYLPDGRMAMLCEVIGRADDEPDNLRSAEALLHTDVMIALYEMGGPPLYMNPAARNTANHAVLNISEMFADPADYQKLLKKLRAAGEHRMVTRVQTETGLRWHDLSAKRCSDAVTGKPAVLITAIDVSELKIARDKARYLADRDQLTGCYNRTYLLQYMEMLEQHQSNQCTLVCFDVDHFKQINDRLGHEMGDCVLKEIVLRTRKIIRKNDIMVRLGGDEFVIVFTDTPSDAEFSPVIQRLLDKISEPITHEATRVSATVSMGGDHIHAKLGQFHRCIARSGYCLVHLEAGRKKPGNVVQRGNGCRRQGTRHNRDGVKKIHQEL